MADDAATRRDAAAYIACFTEDGVLDAGMGEHRGKRRAAMERTVGSICRAEGDTSDHLTTNAFIEPDSSTDGRAVAHFLPVTLVHNPLIVHSVSNITHHLVKGPSGWLVARRTVQPLLGTSG